MNEQKWADRLNEDIQRLLESEPVELGDASPEYREMLELAQVLAADDTRAKSRVEQSLRLMLLNQVGGQKAPGQSRKEDTMLTNNFNKRRFALAVLGLVALLILATLTIPPVRGLAQDIVRRIGNIIISNAPSDAEEYVATLESGTPTPTIDPNWSTQEGQWQVMGLLTIAEASSKAGFPVYEPTYIPDGYWLASRDVLTTSDTTTVSGDYRMELDPPLHDGLQMAGIIAIGQTAFHGDAPPWQQDVGDIPIVEMTIRGQPGVWLEQIPVIPFQDEQGQWDYERWNQLVWAEGDYHFILQTNMPSDLLPLAELLRIAESLTP